MEGDHKIKVCIRTRPLIRFETQQNDVLCWAVKEKSIAETQSTVDSTILGRKRLRSYRFEHVFEPTASTARVYDVMAQRVIKQGAQNGINSTVFAYGMTGAGKTYTMLGDSTNPGIIPSGLVDLFDCFSSAPDKNFLARMQYIELYKEQIYDLLNLDEDSKPLDIRESATKGPHVINCANEVVSTADEAMELVADAQVRRHIAKTNVHRNSSRSHTILRLTVESVSKAESKARGMRVASVNFIDLAGSERCSKTLAEGERLQEGGKINKSLLALTNVIAKLSENSRAVEEGFVAPHSHIPFRDSKLTRLLSSSLGGNANTAIIVNVSIAKSAKEETLASLRFADHARRIVNTVRINEILDSEALVRKYEGEIKGLKQQLKVIATVPMPTSVELESLSDERERRKELEGKVKSLQAMLLESPATVIPQKASPATLRRKSLSEISPAAIKTKRPAAGKRRLSVAMQRSLANMEEVHSPKLSEEFRAIESQTLRTQLSKLRTENGVLKQNVDQLSSHSGELHTKLAETKEVSEESFALLKARSSRLSRMEAEIVELRQKLAVSDKELASAKRKNATVSSQMRQLLSELASSGHELNGTRMQMEQIGEERKKSGEMLDIAVKRISSLSKRLRAAIEDGDSWKKFATSLACPSASATTEEKAALYQAVKKIEASLGHDHAVTGTPTRKRPSTAETPPMMSPVSGKVHMLERKCAMMEEKAAAAEKAKQKIWQLYEALRQSCRILDSKCSSSVPQSLKEFRQLYSMLKDCTVESEDPQDGKREATVAVDALAVLQQSLRLVQQRLLSKAELFAKTTRLDIE